MIPVTIGQEPGVRSQVRRTDRSTNQYMAKNIQTARVDENNTARHGRSADEQDQWETAVTEAYHANSKQRKQLPVLRNADGHEAIQQQCRMKQITSMQNVSNLRRVSSDISMYDETTERLAKLNSTARESRLQTGNELQETPRNVQKNAEELNTAMIEATQAVHRLIATTRANNTETGSTPANVVTSTKDLRQADEQPAPEERETPDSVLIEGSLRGTRTPSPTVDIPQSGRSSAGSSVSQRYRRQSNAPINNANRTCYDIQEVSPPANAPDGNETEETDRHTSRRVDRRRKHNRERVGT